MPKLSSYDIITALTGYYLPAFTTAGNKRWLATQSFFPYTLAQSAVAVSGTATTAEEAYATITVPAGVPGPNGSLIIDTLWTMTSGADDKTTRTRWSTITGTAFSAVINTTIATLRDIRVIQNRNSASSQVAGPAALVGGVGSSADAVVTGAVVTTAATTLVISGQKETAGNTLTLERYSVLVMYGA